jgi:flap endonuclease-1
VRNLGISGRRKLPRKNVYIKIDPELVELSEVFAELGVTREQLVDLGILIGTDFNPDGVKGIGPSTALKLIKEYKCLENAVPKLEHATFTVDYNRIRQIFLVPKVRDIAKLEWGRPDSDGVLSFLCDEHSFSRERVEKMLNRMEDALKKAEKKTNLEKWF